jgi:hypothetical protein
MSEFKPCIRCGRGIDAWAKICPFCNWDQAAQPPAQEPPRSVDVMQYTPPSEFNLKKKAIFAAGGVVALVAAFGIGVVINKDDAPEKAPATVEQQVAEERAKAGLPRRADTPLVPIRGMPPAAGASPSGCTFHPRCGYAVASCTTDVPPLVREGDRLLACPVDPLRQ